jgi:hypothetical protein
LQALRLLDSQCVVIDTAGLDASRMPSGWVAMEHSGRVFYCNTVSQHRQWHCPRAAAAPQLIGELMHAPGYFSGIGCIAVCILTFYSRLGAGEALRSDVRAADELVRQRVGKIAAVSQTASGWDDAACDNGQELQSTFDGLLFSVCIVCNHALIEQSLQVTRHIMGSSSTAVISS